jgi:hypothetical protein
VKESVLCKPTFFVLHCFLHIKIRLFSYFWDHFVAGISNYSISKENLNFISKLRNFDSFYANWKFFSDTNFACNFSGIF